MLGCCTLGDGVSGTRGESCILSAILNKGARLVWGAGFTQGVSGQESLSGPGLRNGTAVSIPCRPCSASQQLGLPVAPRPRGPSTTCLPAQVVHIPSSAALTARPSLGCQRCLHQVWNTQPWPTSPLPGRPPSLPGSPGQPGFGAEWDGEAWEGLWVPTRASPTGQAPGGLSMSKASRSLGLTTVSACTLYPINKLQ